MAKPTPDILTAVLKTLPPRPDASIRVGEEDRYGESEVFSDVLAYGHVAGPREEVEAAAATGTRTRWELAWRSAPLVIHDVGLVEALGAMAPDIMDVSNTIIPQAIGNLLLEHPGPVRCLRLESSSGCPSPDLVGEWMQDLGSKKGEEWLRELVMVNQKQPNNTDSIIFPLHTLPTGLKKLSLGLFHLRPLEGDHLSGLVELRLTGCYFCGKALSATIGELSSLATLLLGFCRLTVGCDQEGISIVAANLRHLEMRACTASRGVFLQYTPKLQVLCTSVRPPNRDARIAIDLRTPAALRELHGFIISCHDLSYETPFNAKVKGKRVAPLPNLSILRVYLQMSTTFEILELLDLLVHIPCLKHLTITRVDTSHKDEEYMAGLEGFEVEAICIRNSLEELVLDQFRGESTELKFAFHVLATAAKLGSLYLKPHIALPQKGADVCSLLIDCPRASAECKIQVIH